MKRIKILPHLLFFVAILGCQAVKAQKIEKIFHQSFELSDTINEINLRIIGSKEILPWVGNAVLTETSVAIDGINKNIFDHFNSKGRYDIDRERVDSVLIIKSHVDKRSIIRTKKGQAKESVTIRIFMPEEFIAVDSIRWQKKKE